MVASGSAPCPMSGWGALPGTFLAGQIQLITDSLCANHNQETTIVGGHKMEWQKIGHAAAHQGGAQAACIFVPAWAGGLGSCKVSYAICSKGHSWSLRVVLRAASSFCLQPVGSWSLCGRSRAVLLCCCPCAGTVCFCVMGVCVFAQGFSSYTLAAAVPASVCTLLQQSRTSC